MQLKFEQNFLQLRAKAFPVKKKGVLFTKLVVHLKKTKACWECGTNISGMCANNQIHYNLSSSMSLSFSK